MELNADFSLRVVAHGASLPWVDSPMPGVRRRMLDRLGDEVARATTLVSYAPGSAFSPHVHTGGEEFLVLEGVFSDEHGDFGPGSYIRNPPESRHTPGSEPGCLLFVKLWQFARSDRIHIRTNFNRLPGVRDSARPQVEVLSLYEDDRETVRVERWEPGAQIALGAPGGAEYLVIDGAFSLPDAVSERRVALLAQSWLRLPDGDQPMARAGAQGASVWCKTGHLRFAERPPSGA